MRNLAILVAFPCLVFVGCGKAPDELANVGSLEAIELNGLQGKWGMAKAQLNLKLNEKPDWGLGEVLEIAGNHYTSTTGETSTHGELKLFPAKSPKHFDIVEQTQKGEERRIKAIYSKEGDTLVVAFSVPTSTRPTAFVQLHTEPTALGNSYIALTYKKLTDEEAAMRVEKGRSDTQQRK